jgi:peptide/nickel transport system substrate-binding protein
VQAQLADVGIAVKIEVVESGLWKETLVKGDADLSIRPWAGISPQSRLHEWLHSEGENTLAMGIFYNNPQVDRLIEELLRTTADNEAKALSLQIQEIAAEEVPIIPMYDEILINAINNKIKGYVLHPWFNVNWEDIYVEGN